MNPLADLHDIQLTETAGIWPPAIGWWLLAALCIGLSLVFIKMFNNHRRKIKAKKQVLSEIHCTTIEDGRQALNILLKRACITYWGNEHIAPMHGEQWSAFLCDVLPERKANAMQPLIHQLVTDLYKDDKTSDFEQHKKIAAAWVKRALPPSKKARTINVSQYQRNAVGGEQHV